MKQIIDDKNRIVEFWLTRAEQNDAALLESLKPLYGVWREQHYQTVVFRSGGRDLADLTEGLLLHNRNVAARRDLARAQTHCLEMA